MKTISKKIGFLAVPSIISLLGIVSALTWSDSLGSFGYILKYIFGEVTAISTNDISNMIITIAVWLLVFITFGDIISTFSTFSTWVSWSISFLIGVIAANIGLMTGIIAVTTGVFAFLGTAAVYVGLGAAFFVFIAINLGLTQFKKWIVKRRAMITAATEEAGGTKLAGTIKGLGAAGKALESVGK